MSFAGVNKLGEKTTVGKCLECICKQGEDLTNFNGFDENLIEVSVARRVPGVDVILCLA